MELLEAIEDYGIDRIATLLNEIYNTGQIPRDISKSIVRALPKKLRATGSEVYRTISLINHTIKTLLRIIMMWVRDNIQPVQVEEQYEDKVQQIQATSL